MSKERLGVLVLFGLLLVSAWPALSTQESAKATETLPVATLRLVQCSLFGGCFEAGDILSEIGGVRDVTVYPIMSEFDVGYDPSRTTPEQIADRFNRDNIGSRVEVINSTSESKSHWYRWCSYRSRQDTL